VTAGRLTLAFSLLLAIACAAPAVAAPGDLDPTFGTYGKFLEPISENTTANSVAVQADGRVIVGGSSSQGATVFGFTGDGKPDPAFGNNGRVALPSTHGNASVALQGDKIVATANDNGGYYGNLTVFRLTANGALDPSFGSAGVAATGLPSSTPAPQVAIAPDHKVVVASTSAPIPGLVIARLLPDGDGFDPSFSGGVVYDTGGPAGTAAQAVAAGPGNEVTVLASGYGAQSRVLRFADDGTPDPGFGSNGAALVTVGGATILYDLALRPNGGPVVVGYASPSSHAVVVALDPSGQPDLSFGSGGAVELQDEATAMGVGIDGSGHVLVTGSGSGKMRLARLLADGTLDPTFGTNGVASARFDRAGVEGVAVALAPDGRIVTATERITGFRSDHIVMGLMRFVVTDGPRDPDADGVIGKRDRCADLGGTARHHGCPLIARSLRLLVRGQGVKGAVHTHNRFCRSLDRASVYSPKPGRDDLLQRVTINRHGRFHARLGQRFRGRVYARLKAHVNPTAGLCGHARSETVKVG
jgi:uncharacterized delta-60 repeat protein